MRAFGDGNKRARRDSAHSTEKVGGNPPRQDGIQAVIWADRILPMNLEQSAAISCRGDDARHSFPGAFAASAMNADVPPAKANVRRRTLLACLACSPFLLRAPSAWPGNASADPDLRWYEAALSMLRQAESWGDQPYGAVLVLQGTLVGEGPSRVVKNRNIDAHAEREAISDAQRRLGRKDLSGAVLYSTARPCRLCEAAAVEARVSRMYYGPTLIDAGAPRLRTDDG
jgi:tRNA(adenine34) deaminase